MRGPVSPAPVLAPGHALVPAHNPGFDAEAFATVFATVFATKLDERLGSWTPPVAGAPGLPATTPKPSFWAHAKHPDVLLVGFAAAIVIVVLVAWMS